jgi:hypothetical protein
LADQKPAWLEYGRAMLAQGGIKVDVAVLVQPL